MSSPLVAPEPAGHQVGLHSGLLVRRLHLDRPEVLTPGAGGCSQTGSGAVQHASPPQARHGHPEPGGHRVPGWKEGDLARRDDGCSQRTLTLSKGRLGHICPLARRRKRPMEGCRVQKVRGQNLQSDVASSSLMWSFGGERSQLKRRSYKKRELAYIDCMWLPGGFWECESSAEEGWT